MISSYEMLQQTYPHVYINDLKKIWREHSSCLYPTILAMDKVLSDPANLPFSLKSKHPKPEPLSLDQIDEQLQRSKIAGEREALEEFRVARVIQLKAQDEAAEKERERQLEEENFERSKAESKTAECGCCFTECAMNRMVHCDGTLFHVSQPQLALKRLLRICTPISGFVKIVRERWRRRK